MSLLGFQRRRRELEQKEDDDVAKYSKGADRTRKPEEAKVEAHVGDTVENQEPAAAEKTAESNDYSTFTEAELKKVKNDDLKAYLDAKGVEYKSDALKEDYVKAILGE